MIDSPKYAQIKENLQDFWFFIVTLGKELKSNAERFPKSVYESFVKTLGKQCIIWFFCCSVPWLPVVILGTKQNVCFGCVGLIIGGAVGIAIGMSLRRYDPFRRYMQAVQCLSYLGIEVSFKANNIYCLKKKNNVLVSC